MATLTPAQKAIADAMIAGTFDKLGAPPSYIMPHQSVEDMYSGILPPAGAAPRVTASSAWPVGGQTRGRPLLDREPRLPSDPRTGYGYGTGLTSQQVQDLGGWAIDPRTGTLAYTTRTVRSTPASQAAEQLAANVPLPRRRPPYAPTAMDVAAGWPAQGGVTPKPAARPANRTPSPMVPARRSGSALPTVSRGDPPQAAPLRPAPVMISTNGYTYSAPGVKSGVTPWAAILSPSQQYDAANRAGQIAALQRQAAGQASGAQTPAQTLQSQGMSPSAAYAAANAQAAARARAAAGLPASSSSSSSGGGYSSWSDAVRNGDSWP